MGRGEEIGSEQDQLEALCGCPMLLLGDKGDDYDDDYYSTGELTSTVHFTFTFL